VERKPEQVNLLPRWYSAVNSEFVQSTVYEYDEGESSFAQGKLNTSVCSPPLESMTYCQPDNFVRERERESQLAVGMGLGDDYYKRCSFQVQASRRKAASIYKFGGCGAVGKKDRRFVKS